MLHFKVSELLGPSLLFKRPPFLCLKGDLLIEVWLYINKTVSTFSDIHSCKFRLMWLSIHLTWICKHAMSNTKHSKIYTLYEPLNNIWPITQQEWSAVTVCWVDYDLLFLNVYLVIVFKQCQTVFHYEYLRRWKQFYWYTVKPLLRGHLWDKEKVVFWDQWTQFNIHQYIFLFFLLFNMFYFLQDVMNIQEMKKSWS
jgi:hypothetical protein